MSIESRKSDRFMTAGAFARHWHDLPPGTRLTVGENGAKRHIPYRRGCASSPYIRIVSVFRFRAEGHANGRQNVVPAPDVQA